MTNSNFNRFVLLCLITMATTAAAFQTTTTTTPSSSSALFSATTEKSSESSSQQKSGYVPKWKKKQTLADEVGDGDFSDKGIKGTIAVKFQQGEVTKETMAMPGQPLRDVATQAGQFIKYGCGKGECGTCEAMCNGQWIRPCMAVVPNVVEGEEVVITVKEIKSATTSSGKFFSVKSFFMGFYNNLLGMVGFVKYRRNAKRNWEERQEYENLIERLTLEKRQKRQAEWKERQNANSKLAP